MKVFGVLCLAAYAVCVLASGYLPSKEYVYKYKGKLFTELDEQHHQHAGLAFKTEVHVQAKSDHYLFKINHPVYDKLNERVTKEKGYDFDLKEHAALTEGLQKPFKVFFDSHGLVHHVTVLKDDPVWSVNFKKSLTAMFQLNFDQINPVRSKDGDKLEEPNLDAHYFKVMEDSLIGECETMYQVSHEPSHFAPYTIPVLNVTKSTNYGHCAKMPYYLFENVNYDVCLNCESDLNNPDRLSNVMHYNLRGDRHNFVIEKVHTESEFTHMPWTRNGDMVYVHTNRTLLLLDEHDVKEEIEISGETENHFDLHFHFYGEHGFQEKVDLKEPHFLYNFLGKSAEIDVIGKEFDDLVAPIIDGTLPEKFKDHHAPYKFAELVKHISTLGYDDIDKFYKQFVDVPSDDPTAIMTRTQLFFEMLSAAGTNPAFLYGKNHLFEPHVMHHVAVHFIAWLPFTIKESSETLFDEIQSLCDSDKVNEHHEVQNVCYLSLSSLIHEHCVGKHYKINQKLPNTHSAGCTPEVAKKYYNHVVHHFENDHDEIELITGIKATGNFGLKEGVSYLKKYIDDDHYPTYFRVAALWALRRVANQHPEAVLEEVVPIYFNLSENHELRIAAFSLIMLSHPSRSVLEAIGVSLHEEHNHQVVSYVSSSFHYFTHSDYPCHKGLKQDVGHVLRHVLRLDSIPDFDFKHSKYWMNSGFNEEFGFGGMSSVSYVTSNDSYLPSNLYIGAKDYIADKHIETVSIVVNQEGLDKVVDRIFGPEGLFKKKKSIFDLFHRRERRETASVDKELKEIDDALHIKTRHERKIHGDISFRMFGHELNFFYFNESLFEDFLHDGYFKVPDLQDLLKKVPSFTFTRFFIQGYAVVTLPSYTGFPIFMSYQEPTAIYYKNNEFKFEVSPSVFVEDRNNEVPTNVHVIAKGHLIHDTVRRGILGVSLLFEHATTGVGVLRRTYVNVPVDIDLSIDLKTWKFNLKSTRPDKHHWVHLSAHPFTFVDDYGNDVDIADEAGYLPYYKWDEMEEAHESHLHDYLGYGYDLKARYGKLNVFRSRGNARKFFAEHSLRDAHYILHYNPHFASYDLDIDISSAEEDPTEALELVVDFDYHDLKTNNKPFHSEVYDHHEDMEQHAKALPGRKFYTYILKTEVHRKGSKDRKVVAEATYTHSCDHKLQKYTFVYDRSPHRAADTEHFKVCGNVYFRYPEYDVKKLHDLDTLELDGEVRGLAKIGYGNDCKTDHKISIHGVAKRSEKQKEKEHKREEEDHLRYNPYSHYYHKCKEEHERGAYYEHHCRSYIYLATRLNHYEFNVEFENPATDEFINETNKWFDWLEHELYYYLDKNFIVQNAPNKIDFQFDFDPVEETVDIEIFKPKFTSHFYDVPVDHHYKPISASPYLAFTNNYRFNRAFLPSLCSVEADYVTTFDNVTYHLPPIDCWKVLAKDCSEHEYFLLLGKTTNNQKHPKAVKVFLGKVKVEILPVTDTAEPIVRVNGHKVDVTQASPYVHHSSVEKHDDHFSVVYNGLYYIISSHKYGVYVYYDGKAIVTHIAPYYKGKQCGLCGDYNHEHDREFRGPEDCVYHNATDFAAAYSIREDGCHAPEVNPHACEKPRSKDPCTVLRNKYVYVGTTNRQLCFSTVPIPECSPECIKTRDVTKNIGYHCLPAKEGATRNLQRLSRERILYELRGKVETHFSDETFPESCQPIEF